MAYTACSTVVNAIKLDKCIYANGSFITIYLARHLTINNRNYCVEKKPPAVAEIIGRPMIVVSGNSGTF